MKEMICLMLGQQHSMKESLFRKPFQRVNAGKT